MSDRHHYEVVSDHHHTRGENGKPLCGQLLAPGEKIVDNYSPSDCPFCRQVLAVTRRACEIAFTESCARWTASEIQSQLIREFGHAQVDRARHAIGAPK